jgi:drug/metabolite transporter (DMT)-like permease
MRTRILSILAIVIGIAMMAYTGFSFVTQEKVVDLGPVHVSKEKNHAYQWSPIIGAVLAAGGVFSLIAMRGPK